MRNLAIIPARGGSKRIPHKNMKMFLGHPILTYSIQSALKSGVFEDVMVSTDDSEIAKIARENGANVPFFRSETTSNDFAPLAEVLLEVINDYEKRGQFYDHICCILPTAPLISEKDILEAYKLMTDSHFDSVCPIVPFSYPILRSLSIDEGKHLRMNWPEYRFTRSQDLKPAYHDSGTFYWIETAILKKEKKLFTDNGSALILDEYHVQDIDTLEDWALAEMKYQLLYQRYNDSNCHNH